MLPNERNVSPAALVLAVGIVAAKAGTTIPAIMRHVSGCPNCLENVYKVAEIVQRMHDEGKIDDYGQVIERDNDIGPIGPGFVSLN